MRRPTCVSGRLSSKFETGFESGGPYDGLWAGRQGGDRYRWCVQHRESDSHGAAEEGAHVAILDRDEPMALRTVTEITDAGGSAGILPTSVFTVLPFTLDSLDIEPRVLPASDISDKNTKEN